MNLPDDLICCSLRSGSLFLFCRAGSSSIVQRHLSLSLLNRCSPFHYCASAHPFPVRCRYLKFFGLIVSSVCSKALVCLGVTCFRYMRKEMFDPFMYSAKVCGLSLFENIRLRNGFHFRSG